MNLGAAKPPAILRGLPRRLRRDGHARAGLVLVLALLLTALLADMLAPCDPNAIGDAAAQLAPPSQAHPLGTDVLGRDVLSRLIHGSRISLLVGWVAVGLSVLIGTVVGLAAGLGPSRLDRCLMGLTDVFLAFPRIFLVLLLAVLVRPSLTLVMAVIGLTGWMGVARLVRGETLGLRERDFVAAARGLGAGGARIAVRHILPNVMPTLVVAAALRLGNAILLESFLSFLGLGAQEPAVSWGAMIDQGRAHMIDGWWLAAFPGLAIALAVIGYNLLGDGILAALDPRGEKGGGRGGI